MIILYILIAVFIAWIWIDYFIQIDIYEKESISLFYLMFFMGGCSVLFVFGAEYFILKDYNFGLTGDFFKDFIYTILNIGLIKETAKLIPFLIFYWVFKNELNEPVDFIIFCSIGALGFSAVENAIHFFNSGTITIHEKTLLSYIGNMFNSALVGYGMVLYKYKNKNYFIQLLFFCFAVLSHSVYEFWLIYEPFKPTGIIISSLYFLITIEIFSTILANCLNNSTFFTYKKVILSDKIFTRILKFYGLVYLVSTIVLLFQKPLLLALKILNLSIILQGLMLIIAIKRLSRFKLIHNRWDKLKISFPLRYNSTGEALMIKGSPYNEAYIGNFYNEFVTIAPFQKSNSFFKNPESGYIDQKVFLKNDETFFLIKIFNQTNPDEYTNYVLKPKTIGKKTTKDSKFIVGLFNLNHLDDLQNKNMSIRDFDFIEWCTIEAKKNE